MIKTRPFLRDAICVIVFAGSATLAPAAQAAGQPHPVTNPASTLMLTGDWLPDDPHQIDYAKLPRAPSQHVIVSDVRRVNGVNQHNYLVRHGERYYIMWSNGPGKEDLVGQRVKFATSVDGIKWSAPRFLTPEPPNSGPASPHYGKWSRLGFRWIARGFWQRNGELFALVALDESGGFFGPSLELRAFRLNAADGAWEDAGVVADNTINNFPPQRIATGDWMMSRRTFDYKKAGVHFLVGGVKAMNDWRSFPVLGTSSALSAEEPLWWALPDGNLAALFRDNRQSKFLYRAFSTDHGRTWSAPVKTDFPDATSKLFGLRMSDGRYVLISNSNPRKRDPLTIALSADGMVFDQLAWLVGDRHVDYPHAIEHAGHLLVAFAGNKQTVEVLRIRVADLANLRMPESVALAKPLPPLRGAPKPAPGDWIDLGVEGETLHLAAELTVPERGESASLSLVTSAKQDRVTIKIDAEGRLSAWLYQHNENGERLEPGSRHSLLVKLVSHNDEPDEMFVKLAAVGKLTAPTNDGDWTLINRKGSSRANLSRVTLRGDDKAHAAFSNVRVAKTRKSLATVIPSQLQIAK